MIRLSRLTIPGEVFRSLAPEERLFLLRFAHVHNDMRHIRQLVITANNGVNTLTGVEQKIASHQHLFALRLWCGAFAEANIVVASGWKGSGLAARIHTRVPSDAKAALREFVDYFTSGNPIQSIRRQFAFHYDAGPIASEDALVAGSELPFEFVTGDRSGNIFYESAETIRSVAMFRSVDPTDPKAGIGPLFQDLSRLYDCFMAFSHAVFRAIVEPSQLLSEACTSNAVTDPTQVFPIIFVDEAAIIQTLEKRGLLRPGD